VIKKNLENDQMAKMKQPYKFLYMLIRYNTKELLLIIVAFLIATLIILNVGYNKEGFYIKPSIIIKIKKTTTI
jgi:hypothetical protein